MSTGFAATPLAQAVQQLVLEDEGVVDAWEFKVELALVALKNSVSQDWIDDFKQVAAALVPALLQQMRQVSQLAGLLQALGKYGVLTVKARKQIQQIYEELGKTG